MTSVLFVCMGNICRSPAAAGILRHLAQAKAIGHTLTVDSCGMGDWYAGHSPDSRMQKSAQMRGLILTGRAKGFRKEFFQTFDYILAVDQEVLKRLHDLALSPEEKARLHLITTFSKSFHNREIPDPFYGDDGAFEVVLDMLEDSCEGLLEKIKANTL